KLRLVFSGRLTAMKGAQYLIPIAANLKRRGIDFQLSICGDGDLGPSMRAMVQQLDLGQSVEFTGTLDFATQLVPFVRDTCDLFICPHFQGDPSCTYLETMGLGVPIAGYANEAWERLAADSHGGWATPLEKPDLLAEKIAQVASDRASLHSAATAALDFA